jgi:protein SCO1/2
MHGTVTIVIDREGRRRANFHGLGFDPTNLVVYVNALVNDVHKPNGEPAPAPSLWQRILSWF